MRLGVIWEAVEKKRGEYDQAYLDKVDALITKLGKQGIYTIVDAHQDAASRLTCGEGIPVFYAQEVLEEGGKFCIDPVLDVFLDPALQAVGVCKTMDQYKLEDDGSGKPKVEQCQER